VINALVNMKCNWSVLWFCSSNSTHYCINRVQVPLSTTCKSDRRERAFTDACWAYLYRLM